MLLSWVFFFSSISIWRCAYASLIGNILVFSLFFFSSPKYVTIRLLFTLNFHECIFHASFARVFSASFHVVIVLFVVVWWPQIPKKKKMEKKKHRLSNEIVNGRIWFIFCEKYFHRSANKVPNQRNFETEKGFAIAFYSGKFRKYEKKEQRFNVMNSGV